MSSRRPKPNREQDWSVFARILQTLVDATPGALGAALVDHEGECVDYYAYIDVYELKVAAAHWQLELRLASELIGDRVGHVHQMVVRARDRSFFARELVDGYALVVVMGKGGGFGVSHRAICQAEHELLIEAGWPIPVNEERWVLVNVEHDEQDRRRPRQVRLFGEWHQVEVIGTVVGLRRGERGYRVRIGPGAELTLVRERLGRWYADARED